MSAERYGFEVSAWVEPRDYEALRADVNAAIDRAVAADRERIAKLVETFSELVGKMLATRIRSGCDG